MRHHCGFAVLAGLFLLAIASAAPNVQLADAENVGDTPAYQQYGENVRDGLIPYADFYLEYPPAAVPVFVAPTIGGRDDYARNSQYLQLLLAAACLALLVVALLPAALRPRDLYVAAAFVAVAPALLGRVTYARYDFWPALLTLVAIVLAARGRDRLGAAALAAATAAKVYPVVLLPLLVIRVGRDKGRAAALRALGVFAGTLVAILAPFLVRGAGGVRFTLMTQLERPLQIESLGSSILLALGQLGLYDPSVVLTHNSHNLDGALPHVVTILCSLVLAAVLGAVWWSFARSGGGPAELLTAAAAAVAAFVAFGRVLSPQYLIWLLALVPLARGRRGLWAASLLLVALAVTQIWSQGRYGDLVDLGPVSWAVLARNLVLVAVAGVLVAEIVAYSRRPRT